MRREQESFAQSFSGPHKPSVQASVRLHARPLTSAMVPVSSLVLQPVIEVLQWVVQAAGLITWVCQKTVGKLMAPNHQPLSKKVILQRVFFASAIIVGYAIFVLFLFDVVELSILQNLRLRIFVTVAVLVFAVIFFIMRFSVGKAPFLSWRPMVLLSLAFEGLGFWWLENPLGYLFIVTGFVFLAVEFIQEYRKKS